MICIGTHAVIAAFNADAIGQGPNFVPSALVTGGNSVSSNRCDGCGQYLWAGPPYLDRLHEMTNSHDPEDHIWFCEPCRDNFYAWCARTHAELELLEEE